MVKRAHLQLLRTLREQVGAEAKTAFNSWALGFLDSGDAERATIEINTIWSTGDRDRDRELDLERLRRTSTVALRLLGRGTARGWLLLDSKVASAIRGFMLRTPPLPLVGKPTTAERGLIAYAVAGLLHELGPDCEWSLTLEDEGAEGEVWFGIEARVELNNLAGLARLLVTDEVLDHQRRSRPLTAHQRAARAGRLAAIEIELPVVIGRFCLTALEIEHLGEGDVILTECCEHSSGTPLRSRVSVGEGWVPAIVRENRVTLTGHYQHTGEHGMSSTVESEPDGSSSGSISNDRSLVDALPLEVVVELGRLKLTGAQVLDLGPGDVLTLDRPVMAPLDLRVGDRLIAKGELVSVEGEAGIRLIEVYD